MGKKKTTFVWILLVLLAIWLISRIMNIISSLVNIKLLLSPAGLSTPTVNMINLFLSIIGLILLVIFFVKLYNVKPDVIKWVHITFGFFVFTTLIGFIPFASLSILTLLSPSILIFGLIFQILMWAGITKHLKRAKREKLMDFS